jgi:hypothetical protein
VLAAALGDVYDFGADLLDLPALHPSRPPDLLANVLDGVRVVERSIDDVVDRNPVSRKPYTAGNEHQGDQEKKPERLQAHIEPPFSLG